MLNMRTFTFVFTFCLMGMGVVGGNIYETSNGTKYFIESAMGVEWIEAYYACIAQQMTIYTYKNQEEHDNFKELWKNEEILTKHYWVGAIGTNGIFFWTRNYKVVVDEWAKGEPNNSGGKENCATFYGRGPVGFYDISCTSKAGYICEVNDEVTEVSDIAREKLGGKYKALALNILQSN